MPKNSYDAVNSRREEVLRYLAQNQNCTLGDITTTFGTSEMTIRRDLTVLIDEGLVSRRGSAYTLNCDPSFDPKYFLRYSENHQQKYSIALQAAQLVHSNELIFIGSGTTTLEFSKQLINIEPLTIFTNNLYIPMYISQHQGQRTIEFLGGDIDYKSMSTCGSAACMHAERVLADTVFFSADGFDMKFGATTNEVKIIDVIQAMIHRARRKVLLLDSSKINETAQRIVAKPEEIDIIVTDENISDENRLLLSRSVSKVIVAVSK